MNIVGRDSSVGISTGYGLDGPGIESRWGWDFPPVQTGPGVHPASCIMGTMSFPGLKRGRVVTLTPHPLLVPWSRKSRAIPLFPYWSYGLYKASVPVQGCTLPYLYMWISVYRFRQTSILICNFHSVGVIPVFSVGAYTVVDRCVLRQEFYVTRIFIYAFIRASPCSVS